MKDLYTFDLSPSMALATYDQVREAYTRLFDELKLPYLVAEADSGDMGGSLSHEFHFPTSKGEDHVISCSNCDYVANEELAESPVPAAGSDIVGSGSGSATEGLSHPDLKILVWRGISRDRRTLVNVWYQSPVISDLATSTIPEVNVYAVRAVFPDLDASVENPLLLWETFNGGARGNKTAKITPPTLLNLLDCRLPEDAQSSIGKTNSRLQFWPESVEFSPSETNMEIINKDPSTHQPLNLLRISDGDPCPRCTDGKLKIQRAIELGHTFHLGTRYSEPLSATVNLPDNDLNALGIEPAASTQVPMQMGCHGIGVSRMIGAVADTLADDKGLNWPRVMAPFEVVIIPGKGLDDAALEVYDTLCRVPTETGNSQLDLILDDRAASFPWKMQDADLVGYPVIVIVGRRWKAESICEVQCRRLQLRQDIAVEELADFVGSVLARL
jgi:prolyl-tRNA synthetase